jgi:toxin secretion/phage lysis holin
MKGGYNMKTIINNVISILATYFIYLVGGIDVAFISLVVIMALDYITGVLSAIYNKKLNSKIGYKGILKKASYLLVIALGVILDKLLGQTGSVRTLIIYFFVANDGISILENVGEMNIPLPKKLKELLDQLKKDGDE